MVSADISTNISIVRPYKVVAFVLVGLYVRM